MPAGKKKTTTKKRAAAPARFLAPYADGKPAEWLAGIATGRSGVYFIRDAETKKMLYVGESHTGRLRKTLLRHFQLWRGLTSGATYRKNRVEVKVVFTPPAAAKPAQDNWILKLKPRDNTLPEPETPF